MNKDSRIYLAGHNGLVGSAIKRKLESEGFENIIVRSSKELDLRDFNQVKDFFLKKKSLNMFSLRQQKLVVSLPIIILAAILYMTTWQLK
jgi:nucleoside-diphosphate-sugar epimerase